MSLGMILRELLGWVLLLAGAALIGLLVMLARDRSVLEAIALSIPATVVFRAGISLIKLTTAARLAATLDTPRSPRT